MSRKNINIISPHFSTGLADERLRIETAAKTLSSSFNVNVFALAPKKKNKNYSFKYDENLTIHYIYSVSFGIPRFFLRYLFQLYYSVRLLTVSNENPADLTIVSCQWVFLPLVFGAKCNSGKIVADSPNLAWFHLPATLFLSKFFKKRSPKKLVYSLKKFNAICVSNEAEKRLITDFSGIIESKINVIANGISYEKYKQLSELKYTPHQNQFVISYIGDISSFQKFNTLINAVYGMKDVRLNIIGDGPELNNLLKYVREKNISNVFIHGKLRWSRIIPYYQTSNLLFILLNENYNTSFPFNLYETLSTGLPVLCQGSSFALGILKKFKNSFIIPNNDTKELEKIIWRIKRLSLSRTKTNSIIAGKYFIREKLSIQFAELTARLLNERVLSNVFIEEILIGLEH